MSRIYRDKETNTFYGEKVIEDDVLIFSNESEIKEITEKVVNSLNLCLIEAEHTSDLYAIGAFCKIIDPELLDKDFLENLPEMLDLENPKEFVIIFTKYIKVPRSIQRFCLFVEPNGKFETQLRTTLLNRRSNIISRKTDKKRYTKRLRRLFVILRDLQEEGSYKSIDSWIEDFDVSEKTIMRDLKLLKEEGHEDIRFNSKKRICYLDNGYLSTVVTRHDKDIH